MSFFCIPCIYLDNKILSEISFCTLSFLAFFTATESSSFHFFFLNSMAFSFLALISSLTASDSSSNFFIILLTCTLGTSSLSSNSFLHLFLLHFLALASALASLVLISSYFTMSSTRLPLSLTNSLLAVDWLVSIRLVPTPAFPRFVRYLVLISSCKDKDSFQSLRPWQG